MQALKIRIQVGRTFQEESEDGKTTTFEEGELLEIMGQTSEPGNKHSICFRNLATDVEKTLPYERYADALKDGRMIQVQAIRETAGLIDHTLVAGKVTSVRHALRRHHGTVELKVGDTLHIEEREKSFRHFPTGNWTITELPIVEGSCIGVTLINQDYGAPAIERTMVVYEFVTLIDQDEAEFVSPQH